MNNYSLSIFFWETGKSFSESKFLHGTVVVDEEGKVHASKVVLEGMHTDDETSPRIVSGTVSAKEINLDIEDVGKIEVVLRSVHVALAGGEIPSGLKGKWCFENEDIAASTKEAIATLTRAS